MVAHVCGYLLAEDVRGVIITLTPAISHDVVSILQVPLYGPDGWDSCVSYHVSVSRLAQSLRFCFQHLAGYSFMLSLRAHCQICTIGSALLFVQLQCVHRQQLACRLVLCHENHLALQVVLEDFHRNKHLGNVQHMLCPLMESCYTQLVQFTYRNSGVLERPDDYILHIRKNLERRAIMCPRPRPIQLFHTRVKPCALPCLVKNWGTGRQWIIVHLRIAGTSAYIKQLCSNIELEYLNLRSHIYILFHFIQF